MILYENKKMKIMDNISRSFHIKDVTVAKTFLLLFTVILIPIFAFMPDLIFFKKLMHKRNITMETRLR